MFEDAFSDPKRAAMLMMAAGLLSPVRGRGASGFGEALGAGLRGGLLGFNEAAQNKRRGEFADIQRQMAQMQLAEAQRGQAFNKAAFQPGVGAQPLTPNDDEGNPMPSPEPRFDFNAASAIDPMKAIQMRQMMTKTESPIVLKEGEVAYGRDGKPLFGTPKKDKPKFATGDTRTYKAGRVEYTQEYQPDGTWKTIGKSALDKPEGPEKPPAAPAGYQWAEGGARLAPIPGGPQDAKVGKEAEALKKREQGALARADFVLGQVGKAISETGVTTAGPVGAIARNIPGSGAYNLNKTIDSIKANIGFSELQAMREASPTGGALGQVAVQELNMLQSVLGSLDTAQSPQQLEKTLYAIEKHYNNWKRAVTQARQEPQGDSGGFRVIGRE